MKTGKLYFVGAGSGDPEQLTVKALRLLREADVVAYDDLVHPSLLEEAAAHAELLAIGYRAHTRREHRHPLSTEVVTRLLQGKNVVRLKSGDPMVFGRTQEEIEGLDGHGIPYEIVPGVSSAFAAAASFGIPLTHRGAASGFRVSAGNHATSEAAKPETLVVYMPRKKLAELCLSLQSEGYPADTPACFVQSVSTPLEAFHGGTIADLPQRVATIREDLPGLVIIGTVVGFAKAEKPSLPLSGKRIVVARHKPGPTRIGRRLAELGADVVHLPYLKYSDDGLLISKSIKLAAPAPDAIIVPHSSAARAFLAEDHGFSWDDRPFLVMGPQSAAVLEAHGLRNVCVSTEASYESLLEITDSL